MNPYFALVPLRNGKRLDRREPSVEDHNMIPLSTSRPIGRPELFSCLYAACDCDENKMIGSTQNKCLDCRKITQALKPFVSRATLQVLTPGTVQLRGGKNASVRVNAKEVSANRIWSGDIRVEEGTKISITTNFDTLRHDDREVWLDFQVVAIGRIDENDQSSASPGRSLSEQINTSPMLATQETPYAILPPTNLQEGSFGSLSPWPKGDSSFPMPSTFSCSPQLNPPTAAKEDAPETGASPSRDHQLHNSSLGLSSEDDNLPPLDRCLEEDQSYSGIGLTQPHTNTSIHHACSDCVHASINASTNAVAVPAVEIIREQEETAIARKVAAPMSALLANMSPNKRARIDGITQGEKEQSNVFPSPSKATGSTEGEFRPVLYFCPIGQDLPMARIRALSANAEKLGIAVFQNFAGATHIIVSEFVTSWEKIANRLGMKTEDELKSYLITNNIKVIKPKWISSITAARMVRKPTRGEHWSFVIATGGARKRSSTDIAPSERNMRKVSKVYASNQKISEVFKKLAVLYQSCPIEKEDVWRSYQFRINAGRVNQLGFEISECTLQNLRKDIAGFGDSCLQIIRQYLESGKVERIEALETDKSRVAMHNMMDIWGVGSKKALELIANNCSTIDDVRRRVTEKTQYLERNQLVGVECYEDFLDEMPREEASKIGEIIEKHTLSIYGEAEVRIMGSYRRGKRTCGDVDVHITCKSFDKRIAADALGNIVDSLWRNGHLSFHLTFLQGMETGSVLADYQRAGRILPPDVWEASKALGPPRNRRMGKSSSSSYMGVFNSPLKKGARRRVDIKFYPYCERIFAALYFTGNGYFNRSMRLWARNMGFHLNDHGLFERETKARIMEATEERQVFERLELVYKAPHERDCFDALEPKNGDVVDFEPSISELKNDNDAWVG